MTSSPALPTIPLERARLEGALEALDELRQQLTIRGSEARDESMRDAYDEATTLVEALESEYRRRLAALPETGVHHASYVFLLDDAGIVHPLPHALYVALVRGQAQAPQFAGRILRLAEWYVRLERGEPVQVVNETYGFLAFDEDGRVDWARTPGANGLRRELPRARAEDALPLPQEREALMAALFASPER